MRKLLLITILASVAFTIFLLESDSFNEVKSPKYYEKLIFSELKIGDSREKVGKFLWDRGLFFYFHEDDKTSEKSYFRISYSEERFITLARIEIYIFFDENENFENMKIERDNSIILLEQMP